jgi:2-phospho-L-lactate guanylyltransferase
MTAAISRPQRVFVLIPMKRFSAAKSRLREQLPDAARMALALAMFERVLVAAKQSGAVSGCAVLTNGPDVALLARRAGAHVLYDAALEAPTLGTLIDAALPELQALSADSALVLMADLPYLEARDLESMIDALATCDVALAPDARGRSTNALAVRLPFELRTAFGDPDSFTVHTQRARQHGLRVASVQSQRLAHDVDTPDDLPADSAWSNSGLFASLER